MQTSSGVKFGKTEAGTVWLDPDRTSPFRFYQFWLNTDDRDVVSHLKLFTWLDREAVDALERTVVEKPEAREAQRTLAREVTTMVHGATELARSERASAVLFGGPLADASVEDVLMVFADVPAVTLPRSAFEPGIAATELAVTAGIAASKGEAARLIKQGGLSVNDRKLTDERGVITFDQAFGGQLFVIRQGRRQTHVVRSVE